MHARLEHANVTVRDIEASVKFLQTAFPAFRIRRDGSSPQGQRFVHVGTDDHYVAITQSRREPVERWVPYAGTPGVNHLGYEVSDVDALRQRLLAAGYEESTVPNEHPFRKRVYFLDPDGNDWEFVQYFSADPSERNDYELPG